VRSGNLDAKLSHDHTARLDSVSATERSRGSFHPLIGFFGSCAVAGAVVSLLGD